MPPSCEPGWPICSGWSAGRSSSREAWWRTGGGDPAATQQAQVDFYRALAETGVAFIWGEAYDQFWKTEEGEPGPHWGLHDDRRRPKRIIEDLSRIR